MLEIDSIRPWWKNPTPVGTKSSAVSRPTSWASPMTLSSVGRMTW
jgi:hypothetical protein